ncbi:MAG: response regulator [Chitinophagaceae bacterium]|nr:MAG: response regulator [Chitinophagaceae bacterium]
MIFYADDDIDDLDLFTEIAEELNQELLTFSSGSALLDKLHSPPPEPTIIFLDINMPGYNGLQILERIRAIDHWKKMPVVMFSTSVGEENIEASLELGATYYLPKNPDYNKLVDEIKFVLKKEWDNFTPGRDHFLYPA